MPVHICPEIAETYILPYIKYMEESDMSEPLLNVKNLSVDVEEKSILHGISLTINKGETHVLMGPNGAGNPHSAAP